MKKTINRREFFRRGVSSALGAGAVFSNNLDYQEESKKEAKVKSFRPLGNLGFKVSDISFGTTRFNNPAVLDYALDLGINYIDTGAGYGNGTAEKAVGEVMKKRRDEAWITTKIDKLNEWDGIKEPAAVRKFLSDSFHGSLKRLQTDYIDAILIWNSTLWQLKNPVVYEFFAKMKEEGKVRFLGISGHRPEFPEVIEAAIDIDEISMIVLTYNYMANKEAAKSIEKAHKKGKAIVAMKTLMGAYEAKIEGASELKVTRRGSRTRPVFPLDFKLSAFKWVLSNPNVSSLIITMPTMDDVRNYLSASGEKYGYFDKQNLEYYYAKVNNLYCRIGCDKCLSACPNNVPVNDILRYRMYFENYRNEKEGMELYSKLSGYNLGEVCTDCSAPCVDVCPYGLAVKERLLETHNMLT